MWRRQQPNGFGIGKKDYEFSKQFLCPWCYGREKGMEWQDALNAVKAPHVEGNATRAMRFAFQRSHCIRNHQFVRANLKKMAAYCSTSDEEEYEDVGAPATDPRDPWVNKLWNNGDDDAPFLDPKRTRKTKDGREESASAEVCPPRSSRTGDGSGGGRGLFRSQRKSPSTKNDHVQFSA